VFDPPSSPAAAGFQSTAVSIVVFAIGYLIVNVVLGRRRVDPVVRAGLVLPALLGASLVLMLVHYVSGGSLFTHPGVVRAITVAGTVALVFSTFVRRRRFPGPFPRDAALALLGVTFVALIIWGRIVFEVLPANKGDTNFHMGFAASLLNGEQLPSNALTGYIPNYYPWLFHFVSAWLSTLTPGGRPFHSLGPLQLLQIAGSAASLFALGYALWQKWLGGLSTALLGTLTGGFGFLAESPRLVYKVRGPGSEVSLMFGDLLARRSHNVSFHNLAPVYPREISYGMVPVLMLLFLLALRTQERLYLITAGFVLGLIGLTGGEAFIAGVLIAVAFVGLLAGGIGRIRAALYIGLPAAMLYGLWFGPLMFNYFKYGGFFDLSMDPVDVALPHVLGGWGIITPLAALGVALLVTRLRSDHGAPVVVLSLVVVGGLLFASLWLGPALGAGFSTLGRAHRYWPIFALAVAICGSFGLLWILEKAVRLHVMAGILLLGAVSGVGLASPLIGTLLLKEDLLSRPGSGDPALRTALRGEEYSWLNVLSPAPGQRCTIAIPEHLTVRGYAYTGYRMVSYVWARRPVNRARVRWREIYSHIPTDAERQVATRRLVFAQGSKVRYREVVARYGVDRVLVPGALLDSPALDGYQIDEAYNGSEIFGVVHTGDCSET
jgi:hypothetical protein